ncbi:MAG TPA: ATP-binding protein [Chloroflexota bacterium]|nr:ATP-binding protein [Chloroflexota bacterium]
MPAEPSSLAVRLQFRLITATALTCAAVSFLVQEVSVRAVAPALAAALAGAILGGLGGLILARTVAQPLGRSLPAAEPLPSPITAAAESERALQNDALSAALEAMADGVLLVGIDGNAVYSNPAARNVLHLGAVSSDAAMASEALGDGRVSSLAARALRGETVTATLQLDGEGSTVQIDASPLGGTGKGALVLLHDVTEARRLDRVRQEFVANASHELLTPIGTVRALADTLARGGMEDRKTARRFLKQLRVEADRLTALARDLVDLAQAQADELRLDLMPTDVSEVIATVLERLHTTATRAGVTLDAVWGSSPPPVLADSARLEQVLINLANNAIKFSANGGRATISTEVLDADVLIHVTDNGVGIAPADLERIFERFYKVRDATGSAGGTGLGLAIVRHLVGAMHGAVSAESQLGRGSTFTVRLRRGDVAPP